MKYKILAVEWRTAKHTVGFVAYDTQNPAKPGEWNSVVGFGPIVVLVKKATAYEYGSGSEDFDIQYIAANGAKIEWNIAKELFPHLDITKHKYYPNDGRKI